MTHRADLHPGIQRLGHLLNLAAQMSASDLHLVVGHPPTCRIHGRLQPIDSAVLVDEELRAMLTPICPKEILDSFKDKKDVDFSFELNLNGETRRFRGNYFFNQSNIGACIRLIPNEIPSFDWAHFPKPLAERLSRFRNGLVLVTGVAGSGKSTSLAMILNLLNQRGGFRIITIEEPVEYRFAKKPDSIVTQREVGVDVHTFSDGLKYGLRQDPDVILVGEIRDLDTARIALTAAETGHMVFSTMHTRDAKGAISRYADLFPQIVQGDIRSQLAMSLRAVISQHLLPSVNPEQKRELALEVLFNNIQVTSGIRSGKLETIDNSIMTGKADGMITLDDSLRVLLRSGRISAETARRFATYPERLFQS